MVQFDSVAVFCGSAMGNNPLYVAQAKALGAFFAKHNISLVYGGAAVGIMGVLADVLFHQHLAIADDGVDAASVG